MIFCPEKYKKEFRNWNQEFLKLEGTLDDKTAKVTLIDFLRANLGLACKLLSGFELAAYQEIVLRGWFNRNFNMFIAGRGCSKSTLAAVFCFLYPIFNPGTKIIIAGPTFRTARHIFNELIKNVESKEALLVKQAFDASSETGEPHRRTDIYQWAINEGDIIAIPLSGDKIRGFRATVLIIDEFLLLTEDMVEKVLMPFLVANADMKQRLKIAKKEKELIKRGILKEEEKIKFDNNTKMICLSSASYTFEYLFQKYQKWLDAIYSDVKEEATYFTAQVSYEAIPEEMISDTIIKEAKTLGLMHPLFLREYCARFVDSNDGYFSAKKMDECSLKPGQEPHLTLKGDPDKKYILSIDPNANQSKVADDFAMCVMEYHGTTGFGTIVHQYANHEADLKANVDYLYYIITHFNIVFIIMDLAGGRKFIEACNLSEHFKRGRIELKFIDFDTNKEADDYTKEIINARNQYNILDRRICIEQHFNTEWIRKSNEYLQTNINYKRVFFGSRIRPDGIIFESVASQDVDITMMGFGGKNRGDIIQEAIDEQDLLIGLVKDECTLIEIDTNAQGSQSFNIPQHLRRDRSSTRARKDSYTGLLLANWACKCYFDLMSYKPRVVQSSFTPTCIAELN